MSQIPDNINLGFRINEEVLRALDLPIKEIDLHDIDNNLDVLYLESLGTDDWNLSPRMLIENFDKEIHHATKVTNADIQYPIEIYYFTGKWIILDGVHRYTKIVMSGAKTIKVRRVREEILPIIKKTDLEYRQRKGEII